MKSMYSTDEIIQILKQKPYTYFFNRVSGTKKVDICFDLSAVAIRINTSIAVDSPFKKHNNFELIFAH